MVNGNPCVPFCSVKIKRWVFSSSLHDHLLVTISISHLSIKKSLHTIYDTRLLSWTITRSFISSCIRLALRDDDLLDCRMIAKEGEGWDICFIAGD